MIEKENGSKMTEKDNGNKMAEKENGNKMAGKMTTKRQENLRFAICSYLPIIWCDFTIQNKNKNHEAYERGRGKRADSWRRLAGMKALHDMVVALEKKGAMESFYMTTTAKESLNVVNRLEKKKEGVGRERGRKRERE